MRFLTCSSSSLKKFTEYWLVVKNAQDPGLVTKKARKKAWKRAGIKDALHKLLCGTVAQGGCFSLPCLGTNTDVLSAVGLRVLGDLLRGAAVAEAACP